MTTVLRSVDEDSPGEKWRELYTQLEEAYRRWFLKEGDAARPSYLTCARALRRHMPELLPLYERLVALAGGGDFAARLLSLYRPTPYLTGCSQAAWIRGDPFLVRNYDYSPRLWDGVLLRTGWNGRRVIAMSDSLWGILDGINDRGLVASLAFGGRTAVGDGFAMPLILRYALETCDTVGEAVAVLRRVPTHMAYNVTLLDGAADYATVFTSPDREAVVIRRPYATNHQGTIEWARFAAATATVDRERFLAGCLEGAHETPGRFVGRFLEPPLYSTRFDHGWGTLYTAVYRPQGGSAAFHWPTFTLEQSFTHFREGLVTISFPSAGGGA